MNPLLRQLQPYPFERLRAMTADVTPNAAKTPINVSIGEPKHRTPQLILDALARGAATGLANYPTTAGHSALREAIAAWLCRRHRLAALDPATEVLPVLGSREALFAFGQTVIDGSRAGATVVVPNPVLSDLRRRCAARRRTDVLRERGSRRRLCARWDAVPADVWTRTQLLYVCSPDNPTGRVMPLDEWQRLFALSDRYGFVIASDECYSEIYFDEARPPLGALAAAQALGRDGFARLVVFGSLSKRSNAPGLRSGYVAGDRALIKAFLHYRTYHGSAMSGAVAAASVAAWSDEAHVVQNRAEYAAKFAALRRGSRRCCPARCRKRRSTCGHARPATTPVRAAPAGRGECRGAARQLPRARCARREPGRRAHPHRARPRPLAMRRGDRPDHRVRAAEMGSEL